MSNISTSMCSKRALTLVLVSISIIAIQIRFSNAAFITQQVNNVQQSIIFSKRTKQSNVIFGGRRNNNVHFSKKDDLNTGEGEENKNRNKNDKHPPTPTGENDNSSSSWLLPSDKPESAERKARMLRMHEEMQRFAHGSELQNVRSDIITLKNTLQIALATDDIARILSLSKAIEKTQEKDPEFVYASLLKKINDIRSMRSTRKKYRLLPKYIEEALAARRYIPRLNMEGLWIGNFGVEGSQLINVTYVGDTLIATKVTGECQVPQGDIIFKAHLFPNDEDQNGANRLEPIPLNHATASKWNVQKLDRYVGEGHTISNDSNEKEVVDGQLIMFDGYFSFLYLPSKKHVFFSRPNPQLVIHLMKDVIEVEDELQNMKDHVTRCFDKDVCEDSVEPRRVPGEADQPNSYSEILKRDQRKGLFTEKTKLNSWVPSSLYNKQRPSQYSFWAFHKWLNYIDSVIKPSKKNDGFV